MHGACGSISNAHHANSLMCPSHRKSSEQLYVYVSLLIHINTYIHQLHQITYNLDYISMPTLLLERKKITSGSPTFHVNPACESQGATQKSRQGGCQRDTEQHRPMAVLAGRVSQNGISLQTRLAYGVCSC